MSKEMQVEEMVKEVDKIFKSELGVNFNNDILTKIAELFYHEDFRKRSGWISVDERLPEHGEHVLVYSSKYYPIVECRDLVTYMRMGNYTGVTHWMPLPEPPEGV